MHFLSRYFYMEAKIGSSDRRIKTTDIDWNENISEESVTHFFDHKRNEEILEEFKI